MKTFLTSFLVFVSISILAASLPASHNPAKDSSPMIIKGGWDAYSREFTLTGNLVLNDAAQKKNLLIVSKIFSLDIHNDSLILTAWENPGSHLIRTFVDKLETNGTSQQFVAKVQLSGKVHLTVGQRSNFSFPGMWPTLSSFPSTRDIIIAANGTYKGELSNLSLNYSTTLDKELEIEKENSSSVMPKIDIRTEFGNTNVYIGDKWLLHLRDSRRLTFRSNTTNDNWMGTNRSPANIAFNYQVDESFPLVNVVVKSELLTDGFKISITSDKQNALDVHEDIDITATWLPEKKAFAYDIAKRLWGNLESWKRIDSWTNIGNNNKIKLEFMDFHVHRMSLKDISFIDYDYKAEDLYEGVYFYGTQKHGDKWMWIPKLQVPYTLRSINGRGSSGYEYGFDLKENGITAVLDPKVGGWFFEHKTDVGTRYTEICWSWYDLHFLFKDIDMKNNELDIKLALKFTPVTPTEASDIIASSTEVDWKNNPEYQIPTYYWDGRLNEFTDQIGGPSGGRDWEEVIYPTSQYCTWDKTQGAKSAPSLKIDQNNADYISAWYVHIGYPYDHRILLGERIRISAMIKTQDVEGTVVFSAGTGINIPHKVSGATPTNGVPSAPIFKGTHDWTPVNLEFYADSLRNKQFQIFFYLKGKGKAWIDDLQITVGENINTNTVGPPNNNNNNYNSINAYAVGNSEIHIIGDVGSQSIAKIYDLQGRISSVKNLHQGNLNVIPIHDFTNGIYFLSVIAENQSKCFKIKIN